MFVISPDFSSGISIVGFYLFRCIGIILLDGFCCLFVVFSDSFCRCVIILLDPRLGVTQLIRHILDLLGIQAVEHPVCRVRYRRSCRYDSSADIAVTSCLLQHDGQHFVVFRLVPLSTVDGDDSLSDISCHIKNSPSALDAHLRFLLPMNVSSSAEENQHRVLFY